jgi:hypothetical protein
MPLQVTTSMIGVEDRATVPVAPANGAIGGRSLYLRDMSRPFLFRIDNARDNDEFMNLRRERHGDRLFSGTAIKIGPGWIPDYIELSVDEGKNEIRLTLIELEANEGTARASCRKYIPEPSAAIVEAFHAYLDTVLAQCRLTADPRLDGFRQLKETLVRSTKVIVQTAGAIRNSPDFIELYPLLDQPIQNPIGGAHATADEQSQIQLEGQRSLSRLEIDGVRRAVRLLYAVAAGKDDNGGLWKSHKNLRRKPLDTALSKQPEDFPVLRQIVFLSSQSGAKVDCDKMANELVALWAGVGQRITAEQVVGWVRTFYPAAIEFGAEQSMQSVFAQARAIMANGVERSS